MGVVLDSGKMSTTTVHGSLVANNLALSWVGQFDPVGPIRFLQVMLFSGGSARFFGAGSETQQRPNVLPDGTLNIVGYWIFLWRHW